MRDPGAPAELGPKGVNGRWWIQIWLHSNGNRLDRFASFSSSWWYIQLARWWSLKNAENSSDFAFLVKTRSPNRSLDARPFVNVAVVESKGWLCHVGVDPLFACIKFDHILVLLRGVFCSTYWTESVIFEDALCSKFLTSDGVERLRRKRSFSGGSCIYLLWVLLRPK